MIEFSKSLSYSRAFGSAGIVWIGDFLFQVLIIKITEPIIFSTAPTMGIYQALLLLVEVFAYGGLFYVASIWYFRSDRGGILEGAALGVLAATGWFVLTAIENATRASFGYPTMVQHFDFLGTLILIACFAVFGFLSSYRPSRSPMHH